MTAFNKAIDKFSRAASWVFGTIAGGGMFVLMGMVFLTVLLRYVFRSNALFGVDELEVVPIFIIYYIGGALTSCEHGHIDCSLVGMVFKNNKKAQNICNAIMMVIYLFLAFLAIKYTWTHVAYLLKVNKKSAYFKMPVIMYEGLGFVGFICMFVFAIRDALKFIAGLKNPEPQITEAKEEK